MTTNASSNKLETTGTPDTAAAASDPAAMDLAAEVERLKLERQQLFERLARAQAEFQNARKRLEQDQEQALQFANQRLLGKLLPLLDNLERALAIDPAKADAASLLQGVQVVRDQFVELLRAHRVETVAPSPGEAFDPARHEALLSQHSPYPEGTVAALLNKGYTLLGRTLRPAQVTVSKGPPPADTASSADTGSSQQPPR